MKKKEVIEFSVTGILIFILLFVVISVIKKAGKTKPSQTQKIEVISSRADNLVDKRSSKEKNVAKNLYNALEEESKSLELKRDPFTAAPITTKETASSSTLIQLNGILWDRTKPMAIINNNVVKIGSKVGTNIVVDIKKDRVILSDGTRDFEIQLK